MRVDVLGSSGTAPVVDNPASGYLVRTDQATVWMDCGPGTYMALLQHIEPDRIDAVVLSHMHPDHCTDVFALYHALKFIKGTSRAIPVIAPEGSRERFGGFLQAGPDHSFFSALTVREVGSGERVAIGDIDIQVAAARHSVPALALRLSTGAGALGYTGDTGPSSSVAAHFSDVDLLIAEASLDPGDRYAFHMTPQQAGEMAAEARAGALRLTHLRATQDPAACLEQASGAFGDEVGLARPGDVYKIDSTDREGR